MKLNILATVVAVTTLGFATNAARADTFAWAYSGMGCTAEVCGAGADIFPPQVMSGSGFLVTGAPITAHGKVGNIITDLTGTWNGFAVTGLLSTNPSDADYFFNDNVLFFPLATTSSLRRFIDYEGIGFSVRDGTGVNLTWGFDGYYAVASNARPYGFTDFTGASFGTFSVTPVPEPEISALLVVGLGLLGGVGRRRSRQQRAAKNGGQSVAK